MIISIIVNIIIIIIIIYNMIKMTILNELYDKYFTKIVKLKIVLR